MSAQAPEIPGFQPLNIRGGGELGIWIEARQVRLDRKVLLKVLPASESHLASEFQREVQGMVQLDGRGALRVIEEGQAGQARFVALDEAGGGRLVPGQLAESETYPLAVTLLSLYLESAALGFRPGRIPVESLRKLPSGDFAVCELGKLSKNPADGSSGDGRAQIAETLRRWSRHLEITAAVDPLLEELRQDQVPLETLLDQWQQVSSKETGNSVSTVILTGPRALTTFLVLGCAILWLLWSPDREADPGPSATASKSRDVGTPGGAEKEVSSDADDSSSADPRAATGAESEANTGANTGAKAGARIETGRTGVPAAENQDETPESSTAISAEDWQRVEKIEQSQKIWEQIHEQVDPGFMLGNRSLLLTHDWSEHEALLVRRALLLQEVRYLAKNFGEILELCRQGQFQSARDLLDQIQTLFPERDFTAESGMIRQAEEQMSVVKRQWLQQQKQFLEALLDRGELISDRLPEIDGMKEIPRFAEERRLLIEQLEKSWSVQKGVIDLLQEKVPSESVLEIPMKDGDLLRGRLLEVSPLGLVIKPTGRRMEEVIRWNQISVEWGLRLMESIDPLSSESRTDKFSNLSLIWGGLSGLDRGEEPKGLPKALVTAVQNCRELRRMESLAALADRASQSGDSLRAEVESLVQRFSPSVWGAEDQRQLENWWISQDVDVGPSALGLFSGSNTLSWEKVENHYELDVTWNSGKGIQEDWGGSGPGRIELIRGGGVLLRGEIPLESSLLFESRLRVQVEGSVTVREKPNLNVILWAGGELPLWFGLGLRPPGRSSYTSAGETVLLPAHGILKAPELDLPDTKKGENPLPFPLPVMGPRLNPGQKLQLQISDNPEETTLQLGNRTLLRISGEMRPRSGGISFQTFESPVLVRGISVKGWVSAVHWRSILLEKARDSLWNRP